MALAWSDTARLLRRTGFGTTGPAVDAAGQRGATETVAAALAADPSADPGARLTPVPSFPPLAPAGKNATAAQRRQLNQQLREQNNGLTQWWVSRMIAASQPFGERLAFAWHSHFATSATKVRSAAMMAQQNHRLRMMGRGDFRTLALAMLTDAAMLRWLDGDRNTARAPNENLAREFMELFALGHGDGYTEQDVREAARALTGWHVDQNGTTSLRSAAHDAGTKTVLGVTGNLDQVGFCDAVLARPASGPFVVGRLWAQIMSDTAPDPPTLAALVAAYGPQRDLAELLRAMFTSPAVTAARTSKVISPVEWMVGLARAVRISPTDTAAVSRLVSVMTALGQRPFAPPSVGGWPSGGSWLSTSAAQTRLRAAGALTATADISSVTDAAPSGRPDAAAYLLGIGGWSDRSRAALAGHVGSPPTLVAVAACTPEYLVV